MALKSSEILQVNATVITGVLILLTVSGPELSNRAFLASLSNETFLGNLPTFLTVVIIIPFVVSIYYIARLELEKLKDVPINEKFERKKLRNAIFSMLAGFVYLLFALFLLLVPIVIK